ncbi:hypothetical protein TNCV_3122331 [Trichonephila clavipes]|nr:hypothetical protein TNCV_3122331 [Trichonephila clavipes]
MVCIPLTSRQHVVRRKWVSEHRDWMQSEWSKVLFTDESQFSLACEARLALILREKGPQNNPILVQEKSHSRRSNFGQK